MFLDGVDSLMGSRADAEQCQGATEIKNFLRDLLSEISATEAKVMTIAATNRPQVMDTAFLRRFDRCIYVPLPDEAAVFSIIQTELQGFDHDPFLDTPEGRVQLKFLARGCIEDRDGQKRWLSGHDIVRAMKSIKADKMDEIFEANYFEEVGLPHLCFCWRY